MAWTITYTIRDAKGSEADHSYHLPYAVLIEEERFSPVEYAQALALVLDDLIDGQIIALTLNLSASLPGGLKAAPLADADVEEGAYWSWEASNGAPFGNRLPTFSESLLLGGGRVDTGNPLIITYIEYITIPEDLPANWGIGPSDNRGVNIARLIEARERFQHSRRRRP